MTTTTTASILDSRLYRALHSVALYGALGILWICAALPVVTAAPSTAAMFAVVRSWERDEPRSLLRSFWSGLTDNFRMALSFGAIGALGVSALGANLLLAPMLPSAFDTALRTAVVMVAVGGAAAAVYVFPMMVCYQMPFRRVIRSSLLFAVGAPLVTLAGLAVVVLAATLVYLFPPAIILVGPLAASTILRTTTRAFDRVPAEAQTAGDRS